MSDFSFKESKAKLQKIIAEQLFYRDFYRASDLLAFHENTEGIKPKEEKTTDETNKM